MFNFEFYLCIRRNADIAEDTVWFLFWQWKESYKNNVMTLLLLSAALLMGPHNGSSASILPRLYLCHINPPSLYPQTSFSPAWQKFSPLILSILLTPIENHNIFSSATSGSAPVFSSAPRSPNHASQSVSLPSRKPSFHSCCPKSPWHSSPPTPPLLHFLYLCCALPVDKVTTQKYSNQSWINQRCAQL